MSSLSYLNLHFTNYDGGDLYIAQRHTGLNNVRMVIGKDITFSGEFTNVSGNPVAIKFGINRDYDGSNEVNLSRAINLSPGKNYIAATISGVDIQRPSSVSVGASPFLEFRVYICEFTNSTRIKVHHVKAEFGRVATKFKYDNYLERTRINNF